MENSIKSAIVWFDELAPSLQTAGRLHWQTLKTAVLAQQTTNSAMVPCHHCQPGKHCLSSLWVHWQTAVCGDKPCMLSRHQ